MTKSKVQTEQQPNPSSPARKPKTAADPGVKRPRPRAAAKSAAKTAPAHPPGTAPEATAREGTTAAPPGSTPAAGDSTAAVAGTGPGVAPHEPEEDLPQQEDVLDEERVPDDEPHWPVAIYLAVGDFRSKAASRVADDLVADFLGDQHRERHFPEGALEQVLPIFAGAVLEGLDGNLPGRLKAYMEGRLRSALRS